MNKIFLDTNVILDLLAKREPFYRQSVELFSLADIKKIEIFISSLSIVNTAYILKHRLKVKDITSTISKLRVLVLTCDLNTKIIDLAINDPDFRDFEDAVQYYSALESQCDLIITRNLNDFKKAKLPIMSPAEYLANYQLQ